MFNLLFLLNCNVIKFLLCGNNIFLIFLLDLGFKNIIELDLSKNILENYVIGVFL